MRAFQPRGVTIYRDTRADGFRRRKPTYVCTIRSRGRTGAAIRARLMTMSAKQRDPILAEWRLGRAVDIPT